MTLLYRVVSAPDKNTRTKSVKKVSYISILCKWNNPSVTFFCYFKAFLYENAGSFHIFDYIFPWPLAILIMYNIKIKSVWFQNGIELDIAGKHKTVLNFITSDEAYLFYKKFSMECIFKDLYLKLIYFELFKCFYLAIKNFTFFNPWKFKHIK